MVHVALTLFDSNITSVEEYVDIVFKVTKIIKHVKTLPVTEKAGIKIRNYVKILPVTEITSTFVEFIIELPTVMLCENRRFSYADLCNTCDSESSIRL